MDPFNVAEEAVSLVGRADLTLVNGRTFAISDAAGNMVAPTHGVVFEDLRMLSTLVVAVRDPDSHPSEVVPAEVLASTTSSPFSLVTVARPLVLGHGGMTDEFVVRRRWLGRGMREDVEVHNVGHTELRRRVMVHAATDFAHVFDVKAGKPGMTQADMVWVSDGFQLQSADPAARVRAVWSPAPALVDTDRGILEWEVVVAPQSSCTITLAFEPVWDGTPAGILFPAGQEPHEAIPIQRRTRWHDSVARVRSHDTRLNLAAERSLEDIASLRIFDSSHPDRVVVAAGAPWFMTLFGRDSLLTAWMMLPFAPEVARGVLQALAELQGEREVPETEEEPGKIIHELRRHGAGGAFSERGRYYGSVDATPLFVMLAAEAFRWGALGEEDLQTLWPAIRAALGWVTRSLTDAPFITYRRSTEQGLANQGWKDSWDGINFANGNLARGPIALVEVQGYAFAALRGGAEIVRRMGRDEIDPAVLDERAARLREDFNREFWIAGTGWFAVGLDGHGRKIDALATNAGHALWTGIADSDKALQYLNHFDSADMWTGWGLRTLSRQMGAYNPLSYHNGSVWPHDTALCAAGAARYGQWKLVDRLVGGALDAASHFGGRPPELFAGISRGEVPTPVAYPASCSPQAWASASIPFLVTTLLGLEPQRGGAPAVTRPGPSSIKPLTVEGLHAGGSRHRITVDG